MVDESSLPDETPFDKQCCRMFLSSTAHRGGKGRGPEVPCTHSRRWAVLAKLEALQAAWGLPGTDFRQRCRRKRVLNVLEGSNVVYFLILTQVSAVGLITLP